MKFDIVVIGASAAGLAAAIFAGEAACVRRILLLERARKPGAKILVSGGGRCNVTNERITPDDYNGGPKPIIRNVLRAFDERRTIDWMKSLGVELKLEPTGKYFPVSDSARTVLDALLARVRELNIELRLRHRVIDLRPDNGGFTLTVKDESTDAEPFKINTARVIVATGGLALPKSGSDGAGYGWLRRAGHTIVPTTPALAPLELAKNASPGGRLHELAGVTVNLRLELHSPEGHRLATSTGSAVFTHFGLSGPAPMNLSRHIARFRLENPEQQPRVALGHPQFANHESALRWLREQADSHGKRLVATALADLWPARLADILAGEFGRLADLNKQQRAEIATRLAALPINVTGDRGYAFAECTAGGVDLREVDPRTMMSRLHDGLYLCGEILDVDGRIGGFNFQWAWASGHLAGTAAAAFPV